jgi:hypothetical protein
MEEIVRITGMRWITGVDGGRILQQKVEIELRGHIKDFGWSDVITKYVAWKNVEHEASDCDYYGNI